MSGDHKHEREEKPRSDPFKIERQSDIPGVSIRRIDREFDRPFPILPDDDANELVRIDRLPDSDRPYPKLPTDDGSVV